jgi:hypothetical protein
MQPGFRFTRLPAILDFVEIIKDNVVFIVMEEWSPQLITDPPCCLKGFLGALRQCIEVRLCAIGGLHRLDYANPIACRFYAQASYCAS